MSSREGTPDHASLPQAQRIDRNQAGLLASGSMLLFRLPSFAVSRFPSGIWYKNSPVTVAGTAPDIRRLPYYPRSRADLVRGVRIGWFFERGKERFTLSLNGRGYVDLQACLLVGVGEGEKVRE